MYNLFNSFKDVYFIYRFLKIKKLLLVFLLFSVCTILETLNIALLLPFVSFVFGEKENILNNEILEFLNLSTFLQDANFIFHISILIVSIFIIKALVLIISNKIQNNFFALVRYKISSFFFNYYINKPYIYFLNEKESSKIMRNTINLGGSYTGFLERFLMLVNDFFIFLGVVFVMIYYSPKIFLILSIFFLVVIFIFVYFTKSIFFNIGKRLLELSSSLLKDIQETLNNIIQIKLQKKEDYFKKQFNIKANINSFHTAHLTFLQTVPRIVIELFAVITLFILISFLIYNSYSKEEIISILTLFTLAILRLMPFAIKFISFFNTANSFIPSLDILKEEILKIDQNESENTQDNKKFINKKIEKINLKNVNFSYPDTGLKLLDNINLELTKNNIYGIFGPSGSGKTTLLNIICGLIKPDEGTILYNQETISNNRFSNIAYVSQSSYFQKDTIKNNVAFGVKDSDVDEDKVYRSLKAVNLENLVKSYKDKLDTYVSELGANFSGGQLQRLSIARAIYANTDIIIFDEPTSFLDEKNKKIILQNISNLMDNRIIIIISHLKDDMRICSKVYKIDGKQIKEINEKKNN